MPFAAAAPAGGFSFTAVLVFLIACDSDYDCSHISSSASDTNALETAQLLTLGLQQYMTA